MGLRLFQGDLVQVWVLESRPKPEQGAKPESVEDLSAKARRSSRRYLMTTMLAQQQPEFFMHIATSFYRSFTLERIQISLSRDPQHHRS